MRPRGRSVNASHHTAAARDATAQPVQRRLQANGITLACFEWRPKCQNQGPSLLIVHATGLHARVWDEVIRRLPGRHVLVLEQRGHGRSQAAFFVGWEVFGKDLSEACVALGLAQAMGIGHSMGAHALVQAAGVPARLIGGAFEAAELDAKRAIDQACRLAAEV